MSYSEIWTSINDDIVLDIRTDGSFFEYIVNIKSDVDISSARFCEEEFLPEVTTPGQERGRCQEDKQLQPPSPAQQTGGSPERGVALQSYSI